MMPGLVYEDVSGEDARLITAGQTTGGTDSDGLNRARARLLIRGFGVQVPGRAPVTC